MAGSSTKISFPQLTEKHDCDHAALATILIILLTSARSQRAVFFRRRCSLAFMISFMSPLAESRNVAIRQRRMLRHELYSMIHVPRLKDENAAELFLGFPHRDRQ